MISSMKESQKARAAAQKRRRKQDLELEKKYMCEKLSKVELENKYMTLVETELKVSQRMIDKLPPLNQNEKKNM